MHFPLKTILPASLVVFALFSACTKDAGQTETMFLASDRPHVFAYTFTEDKTPLLTDTLLRGTQVQVLVSDRQKYEKQKYFRLKTKSEALYVKEANLVMESRNSVLEDSVFVRTPASVIDDTLSSHVCALAEKGKSYPVVGYDILSENGLVRRYLVACGKDTGWLYSKYTVFTAEEAASNYMPQLYDSIHSRVRNTFGGGEALGCDYYQIGRAHV